MIYGKGMLVDELYFRIFEELAAIPHSSGNCREICDWCESFAREHRLRSLRDLHDNIIIFKEGTPGRENEVPLILQGHLDMVFERDDIPDAPHENEPIRLRLDGDFVTAYHTTLGGDDGIAVAYSLAILASSDISHPPLEVLLTSDEEIGMLGAAALDASSLRGRRMINIDSEDEGVLLCGCAGGVQISSTLPYHRHSVSGRRIRFEIGGLSGGHSGVEIHRGRRNACIELGRILASLSGDGIKYSIVELIGGGKDNAIPRSAVATVVASEADVNVIFKKTEMLAEELKKACADTDPGFCFEITVENACECEALSAEDSASAAALLSSLPDGVLRRDPALPAGIETSSNLGIMALGGAGELELSFLVRSAVNSRKCEARDRILDMISAAGGEAECSGDYPAWEYRADSPLRDTMTETFRELYGREATLEVIHAGLECGILGAAIPGLDCVSMGPDMKDIHTTSERLSLSSCRRTWDYLVALLARL